MAATAATMKYGLKKITDHDRLNFRCTVTVNGKSPLLTHSSSRKFFEQVDSPTDIWAQHWTIFPVILFQFLKFGEVGCINCAACHAMRREPIWDASHHQKCGDKQKMLRKSWRTRADGHTHRIYPAEEEISVDRVQRISFAVHMKNEYKAQTIEEEKRNESQIEIESVSFCCCCLFLFIFFLMSCFVFGISRPLCLLASWCATTTSTRIFMCRWWLSHEWLRDSTLSRQVARFEREQRLV